MVKYREDIPRNVDKGEAFVKMAEVSRMRDVQCAISAPVFFSW